MPTLDVNDAFDPSFMDDFVVTRRIEVINSMGRVEFAAQQFASTGVVVPSSPNDLQRLPEMQFMNKAISIYTQFALQGPAPGFMPDEILWHGSHFVVHALDDYSGYGRGFLMAICLSIEAIDPAPPMPDPVGNA